MSVYCNTQKGRRVVESQGVGGQVERQVGGAFLVGSILPVE